MELSFNNQITVSCLWASMIRLLGPHIISIFLFVVFFFTHIWIDREFCPVTMHFTAMLLQASTKKKRKKKGKHAFHVYGRKNIQDYSDILHSTLPSPGHRLYHLLHLQQDMSSSPNYQKCSWTKRIKLAHVWDLPSRTKKCFCHKKEFLLSLQLTLSIVMCLLFTLLKQLL